MRPPELGGVDLNLLVVLRALLAERHVTRAARSVGLSQSAASHALARLRDLYRDPLLVRAGRTLEPTPRALALLPAIDRALAEIQATIVGPAPFDPRTEHRTFTFGMADYGQAMLCGPMLARLAREAPGIDVAVSSGEGVDDLVDEGVLDLGVTVRPPRSGDRAHHAQALPRAPPRRGRSVGLSRERRRHGARTTRPPPSRRGTRPELPRRAHRRERERLHQHGPGAARATPRRAPPHRARPASAPAAVLHALPGLAEALRSGPGSPVVSRAGDRHREGDRGLRLTRARAQHPRPETRGPPPCSYRERRASPAAVRRRAAGSSRADRG